MRDLNCKRVQCDEIWSFVYAKQRNVPEELKDVFGIGDVYTWTAIDADIKLIAGWLVGTRGAESAKLFVDDLAGRLANRVQLTTDGHKAYLEAVEGAFGGGIDYAMLVKLYGDNAKEDQRKYSLSHYKGNIKGVVSGNPEKEHIIARLVPEPVAKKRGAYKKKD